MRKERIFWLFGGVCLAAFCAMVSLQAMADKADAPKEMEVLEEGKIEIAKVQWWIGVALDAVPDMLRAHIPADKLAADAGALARQVVPDSPAAKAGLKDYDVLKKINGKDIKTAPDVINAVRESGGAKITLEILRAGEVKTLDVTPEEMPAEMKRAPQNRLHSPFGIQLVPVPQPGDNDGGNDGDEDYDEDDDFGFQMQLPGGVQLPEEVQEMLNEMRKKGPHGMKFRLQPNFDFDAEDGDVEINAESSAAISQSIQIDVDGKPLKLNIQQKNDDPAKIKVEWDGQTYETTEDKLDVIPEPVREKLKGFLDNGKIKIKIDTEALPAPKDGDAKPEDGDAKPEDGEVEIRVDQEKVIDLKK